MNRHHFKFDYPVEKLLPVVVRLASHHRQRESHYREVYKEAERDLRENGIVMQENAYVTASGSTTGFGYNGQSVAPVVNQEMIHRVNEAKAKITHHVSAAEQYEQYAATFRAALEMDPNVVIAIDADDVKWFKL
jgi:Zn/Cd-binding protein ZinT